jgi:hypothetical protein
MSEREWVTLSRAVDLTGMKSANITYLARTGRVRKQQGTGPRSHKYNVEDLLAAKDEHTPRHYSPRRTQEEPEPVLIDWIRAGDVGTGIVLAERLYSEDVDLADAARYQAWRKYNPEISMGAFSPDRKECYAALMLVPLEEPTILDVLSGRRLESSLTTEDVLRYDRPGGYTLLAASALCLPDRPWLLNRVLAHMMDFWVEQYPERYITRIYAQTVSTQGYELASRVYMSPLYAYGPDAYVLDFSYPNASKIVKRFKQRLEEKAPLPDELSRPTVPVALISPAVVPSRNFDAAPGVEVASSRVRIPRQKPAPESLPSRDLPVKSTLPPGYIGFRQMAKRHGIHENTVHKAIETGRLQVEEGEWKVDRAFVRQAFNQNQQRAFVEAYRTHHGYHQCDDAACVCHGATSITS